MTWYFIFIWGIFTMITHEYGHAFLAKKQGIFKKYTWTIVGPAVEMTEPFNKRWDYMSGIYGSLLSYPLWLLFFGWQNTLQFVIFIIALGAIDIFIILMWKEVERDKKMYRELDEYKKKFGDLND